MQENDGTETSNYPSLFLSNSKDITNCFANISALTKSKNNSSSLIWMHFTYCCEFSDKMNKYFVLVKTCPQKQNLVFNLKQHMFNPYIVHLLFLSFRVKTLFDHLNFVHCKHPLFVVFSWSFLQEKVVHENNRV